MLRAFFTAAYFLIFFGLIDLVFRHTINVLTDILAVICWVIAFIVSFGLADYTVKRIEGKRRKK